MEGAGEERALGCAGEERALGCAGEERALEGTYKALTLGGAQAAQIPGGVLCSSARWRSGHWRDWLWRGEHRRDWPWRSGHWGMLTWSGHRKALAWCWHRRALSRSRHWSPCHPLINNQYPQRHVYLCLWRVWGSRGRWNHLRRGRRFNHRRGWRNRLRCGQRHILRHGRQQADDPRAIPAGNQNQPPHLQFGLGFCHGSVVVSSRGRRSRRKEYFIDINTLYH